MGSCLGCVVIDESNVGVVEVFGKYDRMVYPGFHFLNCFTENVPYRVSLRLKTKNIKIETVTKESLSVVITIGIQYKVNDENINGNDVELEQTEHSKLLSKSYQNNTFNTNNANNANNTNNANGIYRSVYSTSNHEEQIIQFTDAYFRDIGCNHTMKELFMSKNKLSDELTNLLNKEMKRFGYIIHRALIMDIDPPNNIKETMNLVLASQNKRDALINEAEAHKRASILKAEGDCEVRRLEGVGLSLQRQALVDGLKQSIHGLCGEVNLDSTNLTSTIISMQYIDMLNNAATNGKNTFILPSGPSAAVNIEEQMRNAILSTKNI